MPVVYRLHGQIREAVEQDPYMKWPMNVFMVNPKDSYLCGRAPGVSAEGVTPIVGASIYGEMINFDHCRQGQGFLF